MRKKKKHKNPDINAVERQLDWKERTAHLSQSPEDCDREMTDDEYERNFFDTIIKENW